jgi:hypothetical protein
MTRVPADATQRLPVTPSPPGPAWCAGCGRVGTQWVERRPCADGWIRLCPACYIRHAWRLVGPVEHNESWPRLEPERVEPERVEPA